MACFNLRSKRRRRRSCDVLDISRGACCGSVTHSTLQLCAPSQILKPYLIKTKPSIVNRPAPTHGSFFYIVQKRSVCSSAWDTYVSAPAHAALVDFDFFAPSRANTSLGLNPVFTPIDDFGTETSLVASAFAPIGGQLEVHKNRKNGLGVTGGRNDPFGNRTNSHSNANDMESVRLSFSLPI